MLRFEQLRVINLREYSMHFVATTVHFFLNDCLTLLGCRNWGERLFLWEGPQQPGEQDGARRRRRAGDVQHGRYSALHEHQQEGLQVGVITWCCADDYEMCLVEITMMLIYHVNNPNWWFSVPLMW